MQHCTPYYSTSLLASLLCIINKAKVEHLQLQATHHLLKDTMEFSLLLSFWLEFMRWKEVWFSLLSFLCIRWCFKHKYQLYSFNWPVIGRLPSIFLSAKNVNEAITEACHTLGASIQVKGPKFTGLDYLITCHPNNMEYILKTNFSNFPQGQDYKEKYDIFGDGMFTTDSDTWFFQRKTVHGRFSSREFRGFVSDVNLSKVKFSLVPLLVQFTRDGSIIDLQDVFLRLVFDSSSTMIFGRNIPKYLCADFPKNEFADAFEVTTETMLFRYLVPTPWWKLLRLLRVGKERKYAEAWKIIDHNIAQLISIKKEEVVNGVVGSNDLLYTLIKSGEGGDHMSDKLLRDIIFDVFFASIHTTASGLTWFFWLICQTPYVETKILEELKHVVSINNNNNCVVNGARVFEPMEVRELVYLNAALYESLRLYPPAYLFHKSVSNADNLPDGKRVKPGMKMILSIYAMARMKWVWGEDCMEFKPERWINENGKIRSELMSKFFTFNVGPRSCLGKDISLNLMKLASSTIIFNFHVEVMESKPESLKQSIILLMKEGMKVKLTDRFA